MNDYTINEMYEQDGCTDIGEMCETCWNGSCNQNMNVKADSG